MAAKIKQIQEWLERFPPNWTVWVDEGGLTLVARGAKAKKGTEYTYDIGGEPETNQNE